MLERFDYDEFGMATQVGRSIFLGDSHVPIHRGQRLQHLGPHTYAQQV